MSETWKDSRWWSNTLDNMRLRDAWEDHPENITPWDVLERRRERRGDIDLLSLSPSRQFTHISYASQQIEDTGDPLFVSFNDPVVDCGTTKRVFHHASLYSARLGSDGRYHPINPETGICIDAGWQEQRGTRVHRYNCSYVSRSRGRGRRRLKLPRAVGGWNVETDRLDIRDVVVDVTYASEDVPLVDVPKHLRCPEVRRTFWPASESKTAGGRMRHRIIEEFGPWCMICGEDYGIYLDHDHLTHRVRGLVCHECNLWVDRCWHKNGCWRSDYLNDSPLTHLDLVYPDSASTRRSEKYRRTVRIIETYDNFAHLRPYLHRS